MPADVRTKQRDFKDISPEEEQQFLVRDFMETNPTEVDGQPVFEGDIVLTERQWRAVRERKGLRSLSYRWPGGVVPYVFGDSRVSQSAVLAGIRHWEQHTCITFTQISNTSQPHLRFISDSGCYSGVGKLNRNGQDISIGNGCRRLTTVAHEIGHAIGFCHEQSRPDRDSHVVINFENVIPDKRYNLNRHPWSIFSTYDVSYDYSSVMHYTSHSFTANGRTIVATRNPLDQPLIKRGNGLSHRDKRVANIMYNCIEKWLANCGKDSDPCRNDGYFGKNCTCVCPPGTSGSRCERRTGSYYTGIPNSCSQNITSPRTITSTNYPRNYPGGECVKWIVAPRCYVPRVTFTSFSMYPKQPYCNGGLCCYFDALEIRTTSRYSGPVYCGTDIHPGQNFTSTNQEMILYHRAHSHYLFKGWSVQVTFMRSGC